MIVPLHIPKTPGSTFQFILETSFGLPACPTNYTKKKNSQEEDFTLKEIFPKFCAQTGFSPDGMAPSYQDDTRELKQRHRRLPLL